MKRFRLTAYFVITAILAISVALLVVSQIVSRQAEDALIRQAKRNAVQDSLHLQAMMWGVHRGSPEDSITVSSSPGPELVMPEPAGGAGHHHSGLGSPGPGEQLTLEFLAGPRGLGAQYGEMFHGLDLMGLELLDLDHRSLWSMGPPPELETVPGEEFRQAASGEVGVHLVRAAGDEDPAMAGRDVLEVYLPLRGTGDGPVVGVLKLTRDVSSGVALQVDQVNRSVLRVTVATLGALFLVLLGFIVVADTTLDRSRRRQLDLVQDQLAVRERSERQLSASLEEKGVLLKEIHHRVKNNMQLICSLLSLQSGYLKDEGSQLAMRESQDRIRAMALVHEKLYGSEDLATVDFPSYVEGLVSGLFRSYGEKAESVALKLEVAEVPVDVDTAVSCGLIINELVSNALKHAFTPGQEGEVLVEFAPDGPDTLRLVVADTGPGLPPEMDFRETESLGLQLVVMLVDQLEGSIRLQGSRFEILIPQQTAQRVA